MEATSVHSLRLREHSDGRASALVRAGAVASTPEWSWWVAHAMFGATVGLVGATLLRRSHEA